jgi:hypothetical protein
MRSCLKMEQEMYRSRAETVLQVSTVRNGEATKSAGITSRVEGLLGTDGGHMIY